MMRMPLAVFLMIVVSAAAAQPGHPMLGRVEIQFQGLVQNTVAIEIVDMDRDGDNEIVIARSGEALVRHGIAAVTASQTDTWTPDEGTIWFMRVADMNGDLFPDIVACTHIDSTTSEGQIRIGINNQDGTYSQATGVLRGNPEFDIADVDGDGDQDIITRRAEELVLHRNDGAGVFVTEIVPDSTVTDTHLVLLRDLDRDGDPDLVQGRTTAGATVFENQDGSFALLGTFTTNQTPADPDFNQFEIADVNVDGIPDIILGSYNSNLPSRGNALLGDPVAPYQVVHPVHNEQAQCVHAGDFDADGDDDLLLAPGGLWLNDGSGSFSNRVLDIVVTANGFAVGVGDLDMDRRTDLLLPVSGPSYPLPTILAIRNLWYENVIPGPEEYETTFPSRRIAIRDFDRDGRADVLAAGATGLDLFRNNGFGFDPPVSSAGPTLEWDLLTEDLNGDGYPDVIATLQSDLSIRFAVPGGSFEDPVLFPGPDRVARPSSPALVDVNNDGRLDVAALSSNRRPIIWVNQGNGAFEDGEVVSISNSNLHSFAFAAGHFDPDENVDLALLDSRSDYLVLLHGDGTGDFPTRTDIPLIGVPRTSWLVTSELNGESGDDLVLLNTSGAASFAIQNAAGEFELITGGAATLNVQDVSLADIDENGKLDAITASAGGDNVAINLTNSDGSPGISVVYNYGRNRGTGGFAAADLFGDSTPEIVLASGDGFTLLRPALFRLCRADLTTSNAPVGSRLHGLPDGVAAAIDLHFFVNAWIRQDVEIADITSMGGQIMVPDGQITAADLNQFVDLWLAGCP